MRWECWRAAPSTTACTIDQPGSAAGAGQPAIYVVASGDTVHGIGRRFGIPPQTIIDQNSLQPPYTIRVGQWLEVPASAAAVAAAPGPASSGTITSGAVTSEPLPPATGAAAPPATTASGPVSGAPTSVTPQPAASGQPAAAAPPASTTPAAAPQPPPQQAAATPAPLPAGPVTFDWPLRGQIVAGFGPQPGGVQNDGINIAAPRGTPVRAAAAGNVL